MRIDSFENPVSDSMLDRLAALHAEAFGGENWNRGQIRDSLGLDSSCCLGAFLDGVLQGFLLIQVSDDTCEVLTFCASLLLRRRGIGRALLLKAFQLFPCHEFFLEVAADNSAAIALYEGTGFRLIGRRPRYYHRRAEVEVDALCFRRLPPC